VAQKHTAIGDMHQDPASKAPGRKLIIQYEIEVSQPPKRVRSPEFSLFWPEIEWHRSRVHKLILTIRDLYGNDVALMFRTRQFRRNLSHGGGVRVFQLDQGCRAVARDMGVKLFLWGEKMEGYAE